MANEQLKYFKLPHSIMRRFPPPESNNTTINTLWQEEVFRNQSKAVRIQINEFNGELHVGLGNWYYCLQNNDWAPFKGQINLAIEAWKNLEIKRQAINVQLDTLEKQKAEAFDEGSMHI